MGIKMTTPLSDIERYTQTCLEITEREVTRTLTRLGEEAIIIARDRPMSESWNDHTGNLRSSVGYGVYKNDQQEFLNGFQSTSAPEGNGDVGTEVGKRFLTSIGSELGGNSQTLVVVAGMNYADFVEAIDGKDVLATAELETNKKLPSYMLKTKARIEALIDRL